MESVCCSALLSLLSSLLFSLSSWAALQWLLPGPTGSPVQKLSSAVWSGSPKLTWRYCGSQRCSQKTRLGRSGASWLPFLYLIPTAASGSDFQSPFVNRENPIAVTDFCPSQSACSGLSVLRGMKLVNISSWVWTQEPCSFSPTYYLCFFIVLCVWEMCVGVVSV